VDDFAAWRARARTLLAAGVRPEQAEWDDSVQRTMFDVSDISATAVEPGQFRISSGLYELLETVACHRDARRWPVMYRLLWRTTHGEPRLVDDAADDDVRDVTQMARAVRLDSHKMTAFVRFREVGGNGGENSTWIAWYEPVHRIVARTAPFFVKRFATMVWTIVTPDGVAHWNRSALQLLPFDDSIPRPADDAKEALWLSYYESIFNPARLNLRAMQKEMPQKYWVNLPEAARIPALVAAASRRVGQMMASVEPSTSPPVLSPPPPFIKVRPSAALPTQADIDGCRRCPAWERATQGVNGKGPSRATLMLVGEQPGDAEDLAGEPFVGPAGKLLRGALEQAGVAAADVYITNAVKHFNWEPRGKRRIHKTPSQQAVAACRHWLDEEVRHVGPRVVVALGASALVALTSQKLAIAAARARHMRLADGRMLVATYHPAAILRAPDDTARAALLESLIEDLRRAYELSHRPPRETHDEPSQAGQHRV